MDDLQNLLSQISLISKKHEEIDRNTGRCFNIFNITEISWKEVQICRVICELIKPDGIHCQGGKYLQLFCEIVLGFSLTIEECDSAIVRREHPTDNGRRIDLYIEIADKKIPIEAKIYAGDQNEQCLDYHEYAYNSPIYYLTLDGYEPSKDSKPINNNMM